jgi:hypothetical protein
MEDTLKEGSYRVKERQHLIMEMFMWVSSGMDYSQDKAR